MTAATCRACSFCQPCTSATTCRLVDLSPDVGASYSDVSSVTYVRRCAADMGGPKADQLVGARKSRRRTVSNLLNSLFLILALACLPSLVLAIEENRFTPEQVRKIQAAFLDELKLTVPPRNTPPPKVPAYMWDVYENTLADMVRHYYPIRITAERGGYLLTYDLRVSDSNPFEERVVDAVLKLKIGAVDVKNARVGAQKIHERISEIRTTVDSRYLTPTNSTQWIDLDVRELFQHTSKDDHTLELFVDANPPCLVLDPSNSAALVVYIESDAKGAAANRKKRSARHSNRHRNKQHRKHADRKLCNRENLTVSFKELNWNTWIIAPETYEAFHCRGECTFPLPSKVNGTNHAIIQSLVHSIDHSFVPGPCCVPVELEELRLLYTDINGQVMLKTYPEMVVKSCGCK